MLAENLFRTKCSQDGVLAPKVYREIYIYTHFILLFSLVVLNPCSHTEWKAVLLLATPPSSLSFTFYPLVWPWIVPRPNIDPLKHSELLPDAQTTSAALRHLRHLLLSVPLGRWRRVVLSRNGFELGRKNMFLGGQSVNLLNSWLLLLLLFTVMPTIEKLLNTDWKEKLLDKSTVEAGQLKGQRSHHTLWYHFMILSTKVCLQITPSQLV